MNCTEAYKEHIEYTFNAFCRVVIHYAAINAWRDRDKRRQRELSLEYLTEEKFFPFSTTDNYFIDPYKQYPIMICGQGAPWRKPSRYPLTAAEVLADSLTDFMGYDTLHISKAPDAGQKEGSLAAFILRSD